MFRGHVVFTFTVKEALAGRNDEDLLMLLLREGRVTDLESHNPCR